MEGVHPLHVFGQEDRYHRLPAGLLLAKLNTMTAGRMSICLRPGQRVKNATLTEASKQ